MEGTTISINEWLNEALEGTSHEILSKEELGKHDGYAEIISNVDDLRLRAKENEIEKELREKLHSYSWQMQTQKIKESPYIFGKLQAYTETVNFLQMNK